MVNLAAFAQEVGVTLRITRQVAQILFQFGIPQCVVVIGCIASAAIPVQLLKCCPADSVYYTSGPRSGEQELREVMPPVRGVKNAS